MQTYQLTEYEGSHDQIAFSPDGRFLALSGTTFLLIDTSGQQPLAKLPLGRHRLTFAFVRGGSAIAYLPYSHELSTYDLKTGQTHNRHIKEGYADAAGVDSTGETLYLCISSRGHQSKSGIQVVAASDLKKRAYLKPQVSFAGRTNETWIGRSSITLSADSRRLITASWRCDKPGTDVRVWRIGGPKWPARPAVCVNVPDTRDCLAISHDGSRLATAYRTTVSLWDTTSGKRLAHSGAHKRTVTTVVSSPTRPIFASGDKAGKVFIWDTNGKILTRYDWGLTWIRAIAFAPDGLRCAAADMAGKIVIWDVDL